MRTQPPWFCTRAEKPPSVPPMATCAPKERPGGARVAIPDAPLDTRAMITSPALPAGRGQKTAPCTQATRRFSHQFPCVRPSPSRMRITAWPGGQSKNRRAGAVSTFDLSPSSAFPAFLFLSHLRQVLLNRADLARSLRHLPRLGRRIGLAAGQVLVAEIASLPAPSRGKLLQLCLRLADAPRSINSPTGTYTLH